MRFAEGSEQPFRSHQKRSTCALGREPRCSLDAAVVRSSVELEMSTVVTVDDVESRIRLATEADSQTLRRAVYQAWRWREPWSETAFRQYLALSQPDSYVDDFGRRRGDAGFVAEQLGNAPGQAVGAAWYRLFTDQDHRDGYVAADVGELVVAVSDEARGRGLGRALTTRLIQYAATTGMSGLSLHVNSENVRAQHLYRSLGFIVVEDRGSRGLVMLNAVQDFTCNGRPST